VNCNIVNCSGEGLFYSRRIGHDPSRILGAAKITGRLPGGLTIGAVEGITKRATQSGVTVEPFTNYGVLRLSQDLRNGQAGSASWGPRSTAMSTRRPRGSFAITPMSVRSISATAFMAGHTR